MAASAEQNEIIELTDLIEKGPDLPKNSPKTPEPLPLPDEAPATAAPAPDDLLLLPVQDHEPVPSPAPAVEDVPPARDWEAQLDASAAVIGDTGLHLAALAAQTGTESPLLPESLERISSLEESCRQLDRRLSALEGQAGNGHSDATLLMETVERLTPSGRAGAGPARHGRHRLRQHGRSARQRPAYGKHGAPFRAGGRTPGDAAASRQSGKPDRGQPQ